MNPLCDCFLDEKPNKHSVNNDSFEKQKKKNVTAVVFHFSAAVRENDNY